MKLWTKITIVIVIILVTLGVIGILYESGVFKNLKWETLTMIFAAVAGPYLYFKNWIRDHLFSSSSDKVRESEEIYLQLKKNEEERRANLQKIITTKDQEIKLLREEASMLNLELKNLQVERANVSGEVNKMTSTQVLKEFDEEF